METDTDLTAHRTRMWAVFYREKLKRIVCALRQFFGDNIVKIYTFTKNYFRVTIFLR